MQRTEFLAVAFLFSAWANSARAQLDVNELLARSDPVIQQQIERAANAFLGPDQSDPRTNIDGARELKRLKELTDEDEKVVEQLAIYAVTTTGEAESHPDLKAALVLSVLELKPSLVIRVLAPYLDADEERLHGFAKMWFGSHDNASSVSPRSPPLKPVNYDDYKQYVSRKLGRGEEVPAGFIRYIYEQSPGRALLVFAYASRTPDMVARIQLMRKAHEARQQGKELEPQQHEAFQQSEERQEVRLRAKRQIELAEHVISNAIWLDEHGFIVRLQKALPEAKEALATLAQGEWWARLYVAYIMRQHPKLLQPDLMQQLSADSHALVREAAKHVGR
jgi:hypothetical protein